MEAKIGQAMARDSEGYAPEYDYDDVGYAVIVTAKDGASVCLQGDEADMLREAIEKIDVLWADVYCNGKAKPKAFKCYEAHLDAILSAYDDVMEGE